MGIWAFALPLALMLVLCLMTVVVLAAGLVLGYEALNLYTTLREDANRLSSASRHIPGALRSAGSSGKRIAAQMRRSLRGLRGEA
jgi:hypothetical protein